jgi:putative membrane protein
MSTLAMILVGAIAALHLFIAWFEMFAWESRGPRIFRDFPRDLFPATRSMAANQGLYNGFLAAGLIWSLIIAEPLWQRNVAVCFLLFVLVAGVFGAATVSRRILFVQSVPALAALVAVLWG